jgi:hypothetical protein
MGDTVNYKEQTVPTWSESPNYTSSGTSFHVRNTTRQPPNGNPAKSLTSDNASVESNIGFFRAKEGRSLNASQRRRPLETFHGWGNSTPCVSSIAIARYGRRHFRRDKKVFKSHIHCKLTFRYVRLLTAYTLRFPYSPVQMMGLLVFPVIRLITTKTLA